MNTVSGVRGPPRFALTLPKQAIQEYQFPTQTIFRRTVTATRAQTEVRERE